VNSILLNVSKKQYEKYENTWRVVFLLPSKPYTQDFTVPVLRTHQIAELEQAAEEEEEEKIMTKIRTKILAKILGKSCV